MLRITIHNETAATRFIVEGRLVGPWVAELKKCWQAVTHTELLVDLSALTWVDDEGKALLGEMYRHGALLIAHGLMTQAIVEEITG
jgi:hypothetical protein